MSNKVYDIITERLLSIMETGKLVWVKNWKARYGKAPQNYISKKEYRGINSLLLNSAPFNCPYYVTFKQATDLGGNIKKGEKGNPVIFWKLNKYENKGADGSTTEKNVPILRYYNLFNLEQCEGIEWTLINERPPTFDHDRIEAAENVVKNMIDRPEIQYNDFDRACYNKIKDLVKMPKIEFFKSPEDFYSTLFHEIGHSTGHPKRLNREDLLHMSSFGDEHYSKEELTAELTASFICSKIGISNEGNLRNSAAYLQGWSRKLKEDPKLFIQAASKATKAADYILNETTTETETE